MWINPLSNNILTNCAWLSVPIFMSLRKCKERCVPGINWAYHYEGTEGSGSIVANNLRIRVARFTLRSLYYRWVLKRKLVNVYPCRKSRMDAFVVHPGSYSVHPRKHLIYGPRLHPSPHVLGLALTGRKWVESRTKFPSWIQTVSG
jgi:hypothetical protein